MKLIIKQHNQTIFHQRLLMILILAIITLAKAQAQTDSSYIEPALEATDSLRRQMGISDKAVEKQLDKIKKMPLLLNDTVATQKKQKRDWATWSPDPQRALWMALVIPGGGQIYNRKYWKLPIIYGGFMGCLYAMSWNNTMYKDYSQAYLDIMDSDPNTQSRKDKYRRWRDMSFFCLIGVYALSVIDAYVDAELSQFDISNDLSLKVEPAIINNGSSNNILNGSSIGVNLGLKF